MDQLYDVGKYKLEQEGLLDKVTELVINLLEYNSKSNFCNKTILKLSYKVNYQHTFLENYLFNLEYNNEYPTLLYNNLNLYNDYLKIKKKRFSSEHEKIILSNENLRIPYLKFLKELKKNKKL